ncbi:bifunctional adenosylcobinamide kinase/adenosylcobinamide-phosphate guanylyltransferase [Aestuariibius insulae]|uniref:bifunctional adenosylcobinamide kinase/adenosylcobinamide-phosphate guanylyltransferase n=1 Tax=Aestuariibius insulae TaxID=2058287 RepID=UPI00345EDBAD
MTLQKFTLVLGGAASGKSVFAERLVEASEKQGVYVATAQFIDAELDARISDHKMRRNQRWRTVEAPVALAEAIAGAPEEAAVLVDCATLWLTNLILAEADHEAAGDAVLKAMDARAGPVVIVSNDVSGGIVPETALGRRFQRAQGGLNQRLAARADLVVMVTAGLPQVLKGELS